MMRETEKSERYLRSQLRASKTQIRKDQYTCVINNKPTFLENKYNKKP